MRAEGVDFVKNAFLYLEDGNGRVLYIDLSERELPRGNEYAELPFLAEYSCEAEGELHGETSNFRLVSERERGAVKESVYRSDDGAAEVTVMRKFLRGVLTQSCEIKNLSSGRLCVKKLFNRFPGICTDALSGDYLRDVEIGVVRGEWGGEGQLFWQNAEELGLYRATGHRTSCTAQLCSPAAYTTRKFAPLLFFRHKKTGTVWAIQHLPEGPYVLEIGLTDLENIPGSFYSAACGAGDSERQGFRYYLGRNKSYRNAETLFTCMPSFGEAVMRLAEYRRTLRRRPAPPIMFNDYMNCLWCRQGERECLDLIEAAQSVGAEGYCFDDGWYRAPDEDGSLRLGDWIPCDSRFGGHTFAEMVEEVTCRGMIAGVWTELEVCASRAAASKFPKSWFLRNEGERIFRCGRYYFDLTRKDVQDYLIGRVRALYDLGVRYIKNDYNGHPGCGCDHRNASPYAGLEVHCRAVNAFYERLGRIFPDLILENCASGAMRADARTMRNFNTQSISDCEEYEKMPSILNGTLLSLLPEQISVWVYPYPRIFWEMNGEGYLTREYIASQADGRQTAFNLVSGFMGTPLLSGKIDRADEKNFELIARGIALYKEKRDFISTALPVYPLGCARLTDPLRPIAQGLKRGKRILLAVWRREGEARVHIPIEGIAGAEVCFPRGGCGIDRRENAVDVVFFEKNQAVLLDITLG